MTNNTFYLFFFFNYEIYQCIFSLLKGRDRRYASVGNSVVLEVHSNLEGKVKVCRYFMVRNLYSMLKHFLPVEMGWIWQCPGLYRAQVVTQVLWEAWHRLQTFVMAFSVSTFWRNNSAAVQLPGVLVRTVEASLTFYTLFTFYSPARRSTAARAIQTAGTLNRLCISMRLDNGKHKSSSPFLCHDLRILQRLRPVALWRLCAGCCICSALRREGTDLRAMESHDVLVQGDPPYLCPGLGHSQRHRADSRASQ